MDQKVHEVRLQKWMEIMQECASSGMTKSAWCKQAGIRRRQFFYWQKRLQQYALQKLSEGKEQVAGIEPLPVQRQQPLGFCEITTVTVPKETETSESMSTFGFQAEMSIQTGGYNILIGNNVSEKALSTVLAVIGHA